MKQALIDAFEKKGGVPSLLAWADEHPGDFYKLWGRLAPTEVTGDINAALTIRVVRE